MDENEAYKRLCKMLVNELDDDIALLLSSWAIQEHAPIQDAYRIQSLRNQKRLLESHNHLDDRSNR